MKGAAFLEQWRSFFRSYLTAAGKQAAGNLVALVVFTALTQAAAVTSLLLLTNNLGTAGFGVFAFAISLQPYLYLLGTLGTAQVLFREGVREPQRLDEITTAYQTVSLTGSVAIGTLAAAAAWLAPISGAEQGLIYFIAAGNVGACLVLVPLFDLQHKQPLAAAVALAAELGTLAAILWLTTTGSLGLVTVGAVLAVKWWFMAIAQYAVYHLVVRRLRLTYSGERVVRLLRSSLPLAGSTLIASLPANAGVFFVRFFGGEAEAGVFGFASHVAGAFLLFSFLAIRILQPHIAGPYGLERLFLRKMILFTALFLTLVCLGGFAAGTVVILFLLAPPYHAALLPMAVLLGAALLFSVGTLANSYLVVLHRERAVLGAQVAAAVVYVTAIVGLVPWLSTMGAAVAAALAAGCGTLWMLIAVRRSLPVATSE